MRRHVAQSLSRSAGHRHAVDRPRVPPMAAPRQVERGNGRLKAFPGGAELIRDPADVPGERADEKITGREQGNVGHDVAAFAPWIERTCPELVVDKLERVVGGSIQGLDQETEFSRCLGFLGHLRVVCGEENCVHAVLGLEAPGVDQIFL